MALKFRDAIRPGLNTTIAVIATDAVLTKAEAKRLPSPRMMASRAPSGRPHTPVDGDLVFGLGTAASGIRLAAEAAIDLYAAAASSMARAIARAIYAAESVPGDLLPAWSSLMPAAQEGDR